MRQHLTIKIPQTCFDVTMKGGKKPGTQKCGYKAVRYGNDAKVQAVSLPQFWSQPYQRIQDFLGTNRLADLGILCNHESNFIRRYCIETLNGLFLNLQWSSLIKSVGISYDERVHGLLNACLNYFPGGASC